MQRAKSQVKTSVFNSSAIIFINSSIHPSVIIQIPLFLSSRLSVIADVRHQKLLECLPIRVPSYQLARLGPPKWSRLSKGRLA